MNFVKEGTKRNDAGTGHLILLFKRKKKMKIILSKNEVKFFINNGMCGTARGLDYLSLLSSSQVDGWWLLT